MDEPKTYIAVIPGQLPNANDYIDACRRNRYAAASLKRKAQEQIWLGLVKLPKGKWKKVSAVFQWYEKNKRRDKDNIAFAQKFFWDAMQEYNILPNDGWDNIGNTHNEFYIDKANPRIEVLITVEEMMKG